MRDNRESNRDELRADIETFRADVPARTWSMAHDGVATVREIAASAAHHVAAMAGVAAGRLRARAEALGVPAEPSDVTHPARKPVPLGALLGGAAAVGVVIYLVSRRR